MTAQQKVTTALLAAKLPKEALELLTMQSAHLLKLQFRQILLDLKTLDDQIKSL